jgi:N-acetylglucosaminyldiphosphoundecaprenol N-acetyl-beta-D-mannosaminyltransferase
MEILLRKLFDESLANLPSGKLLINTLNAYCFNVSQQDQLYREALLNSDVLIPDGIGVVWALKWLTGKKIKKVAGIDLLYYEMKHLQQVGGKCFFLGSSEATLTKIQDRVRKEFPMVKVATYSPSYQKELSNNENQIILNRINFFKPDVIFIGMSAPKQEKWAFRNFDKLQAKHVCCVGAVFDFFAGSISRAPDWMINLGLEWFYRFLREPRRLWRRYLLGNPIFIWNICLEKTRSRRKKSSSLPYKEIQKVPKFSSH